MNPKMCFIPIIWVGEKESFRLPLQKFVSLNQSENEINNKLEQLRALDNNIKIKVSLAKDSPIGIDTEEDFVAIKKIMEYKSKWKKFIFKVPMVLILI